MFEHGFYPMISKPTRITKTTSTCLDHIWTNSYDNEATSGVIFEKISDHLITFQQSSIKITRDPKINNQPKTRKKTNLEKMSEMLSTFDATNVFRQNDADKAYSTLGKKLMKPSKVAPMK